MASGNGPMSEGDLPTALQQAELSPMALRQYGVCLAMNVLKNTMKMLDGVHESCAEAGLTSTEEKDRCGVAWPLGDGTSPEESELVKDVAKFKKERMMEMKYQGMRLSGLAAVERLLDEFRFLCENMLANSDSHCVISRDAIVNILLSKNASNWSNKNRFAQVDRVYVSREIATEACKKTLKEMIDVLCARVIFIIKEALVPCISDMNFRNNIKVARAVDEDYKKRIQIMLQTFLCEQLDSLQMKLEEGLLCRLTELYHATHSQDISFKTSQNVSRAKGGARPSSESKHVIYIPAGRRLEKSRQVLNENEEGFRLHPSVSDEDDEPISEHHPMSDGPISRKPLLPTTQMSVPETPSPDGAGAGEAAFRVMHFSLHTKSTKMKRKSTGVKIMSSGIKHATEHMDLKSAGIGEDEDVDQLANQVGLLYSSMMTSFSTQIRSAVIPLLLQLLNATDLGTQLCLFVCKFSDNGILHHALRANSGSEMRLPHDDKNCKPRINTRFQ